MKNIILPVALALSALCTLAQSRTEFAGVNYKSFGKSSLENPPALGNLNELKVTYHQVEVFGLIPIVKKNGTNIIGRIEYENTSFDYDNTSSNGNEIRPDQLHLIDLRLVYRQELNSTWSLVGVLNPTLSSDFRDGLSGRDLLFNGGMTLTKSLSDKFSLGLGAMSTYAFGERQVVPLIDVRYESEDDKFFAQVRFPRLTLAYSASPKLEIGFKAIQEGSQFNYKNAVTQASEESDFVKFSTLNFGPTISYEISKNMYFTAQAGLSVSRQLSVFNTSNEELVDLTPSDSRFVSVGFNYALRQ